MGCTQWVGFIPPIFLQHLALPHERRRGSKTTIALGCLDYGMRKTCTQSAERRLKSRNHLAAALRTPNAFSSWGWFIVGLPRKKPNLVRPQNEISPNKSQPPPVLRASASSSDFMPLITGTARSSEYLEDKLWTDSRLSLLKKCLPMDLWPKAKQNQSWKITLGTRSHNEPTIPEVFKTTCPHDSWAIWSACLVVGPLCFLGSQ